MKIGWRLVVLENLSMCTLRKVALMEVSFLSAAQYIEWSMAEPVSLLEDRLHSSNSELANASGKE